LRYAIPDEALRYAIPDEALRYAIPDEALRYAISDEALRYAISDEALRYANERYPSFRRRDTLRPCRSQARQISLWPQMMALGG
jgi:predicted RNA-binding protein